MGSKDVCALGEKIYLLASAVFDRVRLAKQLYRGTQMCQALNHQLYTAGAVTLRPMIMIRLVLMMTMEYIIRRPEPLNRQWLVPRVDGTMKLC